MKRRIVSSFMIAAMALSLVACGGGAGSDESSQTSESKEASEDKR